jgi:hypothetical protein
LKHRAARTDSRSILPRASVFILDLDGRIRFRIIDRNYKRHTTTRTYFRPIADLRNG